MSPGKLAAQCGHAAMAFLTWPMRGGGGVRKTENGYAAEIQFDRETYEDWICGSFVKTVCEARNRNQLMKAAA